jgi:hypothetical protein
VYALFGLPVLLLVVLPLALMLTTTKADEVTTEIGERMPSILFSKLH